MVVHGVMERVLDQTAQYVAANLLTEGALEHAPRRLARTEPGKSRLPADLRERAIDLGLHGGSGDLHLQALAARSDLLDRHRGVLVRVRGVRRQFAASMGSQTCDRDHDLARGARGGLEPHGLPREI